ncbi:MAG: hypothetical protein A2Z27_05620 [candidate division Zixibacteria bacterium RBG_16_50_21]|nr:MAG: hypothetical protein A2Z27_05620 [candidate division Zixibacteria bacterium RBG_16_50_21]
MIWEIKSIDLWSAVKISFVANAVVGFVLGIFLGLIFAAMSQFLAPFMAMSGQDLADLEAASGLGSLIVMPFFLAFFMAVIYGVIGTGILVLIYNLVAKFAGGIKVSLGSDVSIQEARSTRPTLGYE